MDLKALARPLFITLGWLSVGLGVLGIVFPLLPAMPFLLVAIWAFSKSSPEMAERIRQHRLAGPMIRDWQDAGVIQVKAKAVAVVMMSAMFAYVHFATAIPAWAEAVLACVLTAAAAYIVTRPSENLEE